MNPFKSFVVLSGLTLSCLSFAQEYRIDAQEMNSQYWRYYAELGDCIQWENEREHKIARYEHGCVAGDIKEVSIPDLENTYGIALYSERRGELNSEYLKDGYLRSPQTMAFYVNSVSFKTVLKTQKNS